jgi:transposase InsO family protein
MDQAIAAYVKTCALCQQYKITATKKYGKIPLPKPPAIKPWEEVHVDMIGPWTVQFTLTNQPGTTRVEHLQALTIIDKGTGWPEFVATRSKASQHIALLFDGVWLCRYPRPSRVIFDNWGEFTGGEFQELLHSYGVQPVPTTIRNPKSNGVVERVHLYHGGYAQNNHLPRGRLDDRSSANLGCCSLGNLSNCQSGSKIQPLSFCF